MAAPNLISADEAKERSASDLFAKLESSPHGFSSVLETEAPRCCTHKAGTARNLKVVMTGTSLEAAFHLLMPPSKSLLVVIGQDLSQGHEPAA